MNVEGMLAITSRVKGRLAYRSQCVSLHLSQRESCLDMAR